MKSNHGDSILQIAGIGWWLIRKSLISNSLGLFRPLSYIRMVCLKPLDKYLMLTEQVNSLNDPKIHRLLGYPQEFQGEMQLECQLVSHGLYMGDADAYNDPQVNELKPGARNWQLLFQLDSEQNLDMFWGDVGRLYFWIPQDALKARHFDQVWLILQC